MSGSMSISVQEITDREQWDGFLTSQPRGHLLQSYEWGELNRYLGGNIYRLGALENGRMVGALMLSVAQVHVLARKERAVVLRLEPNIADDDPAIDEWLAAYRALGFQINPTAMHGRRSWVLDIRPSAEELLANFKMTWRQNVRSAERKGVVIREAENDA